MTMSARARGLALVAAITVVLWQFPLGRYLLYPLTILATWFHEMGHGLCAMLVGGTFVRLQLFPDGSGYAVYAASPHLGRLGVALVAAAGPLGPALAGSSLILLSLRPKWSRLGLTGVAAVMLVSAFIWIRTLFGFGLIALLALVLLLIRFKASDRWHGLSLQFLGVQACISIFLQVRYLFTESVSTSGRVLHSDTGQIAAALLLPYWFWAILLTGLTLWLPLWSLGRVLRGR
jgi:hypothetical protein